MLISTLNSQLQHQLGVLLASTRSALETMLSGGQRPALALVPANGRQSGARSVPTGVAYVESSNGIFVPQYPAINGPVAHAAVCMHANPVTKAWRVLGFGKTKTGDTGRSQPSRFAT